MRASTVQEQNVEEGACFLSRFRFSNGSLTGVNGRERVSVRCKASSQSPSIQLSTRDLCAAAIEGENGGVVAMVSCVVRKNTWRRYLKQACLAVLSWKRSSVPVRALFWLYRYTTRASLPSQHLPSQFADLALKDCLYISCTSSFHLL